MVQLILSSMDADEVNSIGDSVESTQVVNIVNVCYDEFCSGANLPEHYELFNLDATTSTTPVILQKPSTVDEMLWMKYNSISTGETDPKFKALDWMKPEDFLDRMMTLHPSEANVDTCSWTHQGNTVDLYYYMDRAPKVFTSFDDDYIICDAFDNTIEAMLQKSKTLAYGRLLQNFVEQDDWVPNLDAQQFTLLLNECKAMAWAEMKQAQHAKAEKSARKGWITLQKNKKDIIKGQGFYDNLPNYGRKR